MTLITSTTRSLLLTAAAALALAGCATDDSLPTRPRTASFLAPSDQGQQNAEQRSLEKPARDLPTNRTDLPGQSAAAAASTSVLTLDASPADPAPHPTNPDFPISGFTGPSKWKAIGHTTGPATEYNRDNYPFIIPHIPPNPGTTPMPGTTPIPGGDWSVDHSWGQSLTLTDYPHRDWTPTTANYQSVTIKHDPVYYFNLQEHLPVKQNDGTVRADARSAAYEIPWFFLNTAALPVLMVLEPPFAQRTTAAAELDPSLTGHVTDGQTVPAPYPGVLKWDYPFLNPDGTVKQSGSEGQTRPAN